MNRILRLSIFPAIGLLIIIGASTWSGRDLNLRLRGKSAEGRIVAMALERDGKDDLISGIDTTLVLGLANGGRIEAEYKNYALVAATFQPAGDLLAKQPIDILTAPVISPEIRKVLADSVSGDSEIVRWALLRENRRTDDARVVRIEKTETTHGYFGLDSVPLILDVKNGRVTLEGRDAQFTTATIRAVFDSSDRDAVAANKGDTMTDYQFLRNGEPFVPAKKNFFLGTEAYQTRFRPVFSFEVNDTEIARLSHIGRHGGPTLALRLFEGCQVYYDPKNPVEAILIATPGPVNGEYLAWISRFCEGAFAQWGSGTLIALCGVMFLITGLLFISLAIWPPKTAIATPE